MSFWRAWLDEAEKQPDLLAARRHLEGARCWLALHEEPEERSAPFDLDAWALAWAQQHTPLSVIAGTPLRREGQPRSLGALLRALCLEQYPEGAPPLQVSGDTAEVRVAAADGESRWVPRPGVVVQTLAEMLPVQLGRDGSWLFRCTCPALEKPGDASAEAVDRETLQRSTMDDAEFEGELIDAFLEEGARQLVSLERDYNAHTLHSLKGSANMVGALPFAALLGDQEHRLQAERLPDLQAEFARVSSWLGRYRATRS